MVDSPLSVSADPTRDWPEDASHENGQYERMCLTCGGTFIGHKRRLTCRKCAADRPVENSELREALNEYEKALYAWPFDSSRETATRSRIEELFASIRQELDRARKPFMCNVCGGAGKPTSGLPCICGGKGTEVAELEGFRALCFDLEAEISRLRAERLTPEEAGAEVIATQALEIITECRAILRLEKGESLTEAVQTLAPKCEICGGTGTVARMSFAVGADDDQPCPTCGIDYGGEPL